ncbi:MAG TPA: polyprenyl synthetase family protein [Clostridiales bacterium]|nr:polyprenyl synthetase family protein [Clostridiales bacterium]
MRKYDRHTSRKMSNDFPVRLEFYKNIANETLDAIFESKPIIPELKQAMEYSVTLGGKRLRPALCYSVWEMLGGDLKSTTAVSAIRLIGAAIELIHTYSLIHDDLPCMDDDDFRRGKPSNHKVFGEAMAVLAGDALLNLAYEVLFDVCRQEKTIQAIKAAQLIAACAGSQGMVAGQALDMSSKSSNDEELLNTIHSLKTGMLFRASILSAAELYGISGEKYAELDRFAHDFGLLFQITDDLLDVCGSKEELGKTTGKDEAAGKLTYATVYGVNEAQVRAESIASSAKAHISHFDNNDFLIELVEQTLTRAK